MNNLFTDFRKEWEGMHEAVRNGRVLLAVSGGLDSMVMAHLFCQAGITIGVAHCNFGLRGAASDMDQALVNDWCLQNGVPFHTTRFETKGYAAEWKKGTQETARILRYEWFDTLRQEFGYCRTATAHHANDNAETLLINLFRGTGIQGLHGIVPDNGQVIRPLLFASRADIQTYAHQEHIAWREDESNASDDYSRNAIRHHVIPEVEKLFPNVVGNINESIKRFAEAELLYAKAIDAQRKKLIEKRGNDYYLPIRKLRHVTPLHTICYELLQPFGFTAAQVPQVIKLLGAEAGRYVMSSTHRVIRDREFLVITTVAAHSTDMVQVEGVPCLVQVDTFDFHFTIKERPEVIPTERSIAYLDANAITFPLVLRRWRIGDYLYPLGMGMKKKKVSRLLIEQKIPLHAKEHIWVLECNKRLLWVAGIRPDERFKVTAATQQVLVIEKRERR